MSATTGPVLALGATTVVNRVVFQDQPMDWRIPIATGLAAVGFSLAEKAFPQGAEILAWTAFLAALITRLDPGVPSPAESAIEWWNKTKPDKATDMPHKGGGHEGESKEV